MFGQFLKLREAQKAFRDGCYHDALRMAEDPDIAEHLKAIALRAACLEALGKEARALEDRGELTLAVAEIKNIAAHEATPEADDRANALVERKKDRDQLSERVRARLFRAKLDLGRGDLLSARQVIEAIDKKTRSDEMEELLREIDERIKGAAALLEKAKKIWEKDPATAESYLLDAEKQHPRAEGLIEGFRELSHSRVKHLVSSKVGDPAVLSFLMEWALFKRRHLDGVRSDLDADEKQLRKFVQKKISKHLEGGKLAQAERLLERLADSIGLDPDLAAIEAGIRSLESGKNRLAQGDFSGASDDLKSALAQLSKKVGMIATLEKELKIKRKEIDPLFAKAEACLRRGDLAQAKGQLLDVLNQLPGHVGSLRLLEIVNERLGKKAKVLVEVRALMDRRRLDSAKRLLEDLFADGGDTHEISILMKEIEVLGKAGDGAPEPKWSLDAATMATHTAAELTRCDDAGHGPLSQCWLLSVEEHGEHMIFESDTLVFGNAVAKSADILVLANLASRHATLTRKTSFHGGVAFRLEALGGKEMVVNGKKLSTHDLKPGDEVRLGRDFRFRFTQPNERSKAAVLELISGHDVMGARHVILMPPVGRAGSIRVGPFDDAHVSTFGDDGDMELYRESSDPGANLVVVSTQGVAVDGDEVRAKAIIYDRSRALCGELGLHVRNLPNSPGLS